MMSTAILAARYYRARLRTKGHGIHDLDQIASRIRPGSSAIDVGANYGLFSYAFSKKAKTVHAFEPQPSIPSGLRRIRNVVLHTCALSDKPGTAVISMPKGLHGHATLERDYPITHKVELRTLDSFGLSNISVIKIDVEGHEMKVIDGGLATITQERPFMLIEIEQRHHDSGILEYLSSIEDIGYRGYFFDANLSKTHITDFDLSKHQNIKYADQGDLRYCINFLFEPY